MPAEFPDAQILHAHTRASAFRGANSHTVHAELVEARIKLRRIHSAHYEGRDFEACSSQAVSVSSNIFTS